MHPIEKSFATLEHQPNSATALAEIGRALLEADAFEQGRQYFEQALAADPLLPEVIDFCVDSPHADHVLNEALCAVRRVLAARPNYGRAYFQLGRLLDRKGETLLAIGAFRRAAALDERHDFYSALGNALARCKRVKEALKAFEDSLRLNRSANALADMAGICMSLGESDRAITFAQESLRLEPRHWTARLNLCGSLLRTGQLEKSRLVAEELLLETPETALQTYQQAHFFKLFERDREAIAKFRECMSHESCSADAHFFTGVTLLSHGKLRAGWKEYEWRWKTKLQKNVWRPTLPEWRGEDLAGKRILVYSEQGFGDVIHFVRYCQALKERGAYIVLQTYPELKRLMTYCPFVDSVSQLGDVANNVSYAIPILGLPGAFGTITRSIPEKTPYLFPPGHESSPLGDLHELKVGLVWAGNGEHPNDARRSVPVGTLGPLWTVPSVKFFSLQLNRDDELRSVQSTNPRITDLSGHISDFADTAHWMSELDLVVGVDTAVMHLAGALNIPGWLLLPFDPDWRWGRKGERTPWYKSLRIFRQSIFGTWDEVIAKVRNRLQQCTADRQLL